jgi:hypothetical protein
MHPRQVKPQIVDGQPVQNRSDTGRVILIGVAEHQVAQTCVGTKFFLHMLDYLSPTPQPRENTHDRPNRIAGEDAARSTAAKLTRSPELIPVAKAWSRHLQRCDIKRLQSQRVRGDTRARVVPAMGPPACAGRPAWIGVHTCAQGYGSLPQPQRPAWPRCVRAGWMP